ALPVLHDIHEVADVNDPLGVRRDARVVGVFQMEDVDRREQLFGAVTLGAVTLGAVTLGAVTLGAVTLGAVTLGAVTRGAVTRGAVTRGAVAGPRTGRGRGEKHAKHEGKQGSAHRFVSVQVVRSGRQAYGDVRGFATIFRREVPLR